jgi:hypothetical protein
MHFDTRSSATLARVERLRDDLIVFDPNARSNANAMPVVAEVLRGHVALLLAPRERSASRGELDFAINLRTFALGAPPASDPGSVEKMRGTRTEYRRHPRANCAYGCRSAG